ncbi:MAG: amidohydrolase [Firmicutes bacterium]|nr:amidohydrolase [Bacillota bacterium]
MKVRRLAAQLQPQLVEIRRHFHMYPEPSWEEVSTSQRIAQELAKLGIPVRRLAKTGLVGTLKGDRPGRTVALRADMDALSIQEETGLSFASKNKGFMHACGHDCHIASLLGAAKILARMRGEIAGTIKFFFQPAEESLQGAKVMMAEGAMDGIDAIFGMHVSSELPVGTVNIVSGPRMASADMFTIRVQGKGGHGSAPQQGVDAILVGSALVINLQSIVSREFNPLEPLVVHVGKLISGDRFNIIASRAIIEGTNRTFNHEIRKQLPDIMQRIIKNTTGAYRASAELEYKWGCPVLVNDDSLSKMAQGTVKRLYGNESLVGMAPLTASEDFSYYVEKAPGAYAFLGVGNKEKDTEWPLHHSHFNVDENALQIGAALYAQFALDYLAAK